MLLDVDENFAGFVGLMKREAVFDGQKKLIAGVRGLVVDTRWRRKGLGKVLMREAHKVIFRTLKADYGLLLCLGDLEAFYASLGWKPLQCQVFVENENRKAMWTESAMILPEEADSTLATFNEIDLMGKAF